MLLSMTPLATMPLTACVATAPRPASSAVPDSTPAASRPPQPKARKAKRRLPKRGLPKATSVVAATPPAVSDEGPGEHGVASYYSDALAGRLTASGVPYDPEQATCAHKKLPFGTRVQVIDVESGRSVTCVVNDRGPFVQGRIIDLSKHLARELGLLERGLAKVRVVVLPAEDGSAPEGP